MNELATNSMIPDGFEQLKRLVDNINRWRPRIEEALRYTDYTHSFDDLVGMIMSNQLLFFCTDEAFAIMERVQYPQYANLHCFLAGGRLSTLLEHIDDMKHVAEQLGCENFTMAGRRGWDRILSRKGWTFACVTMSTPVEGDDNG